MSELIHTDLTAHLGLALPHPGNDLGDDVLRLRGALTAIDAKFAALDLLLQSDDVNLDQLQELVNAIKTNAGDVLDLLASKADSEDLAAVVAALATKASSADLAAVAAAAFPPPATRITGYTELQPGKRYELDSTAGPFSVLLPSAAGAWVWLRDVAGMCDVNPVTVLRNAGQTIDGQADDLLIDVQRDSVFLSLDTTNWTD